jgi:drug/metabolite transporter (DMT)-like permease
VTLIAAAGWVFTKNALAEFPPYTFLALRFSLAALVLACLCRGQLVQLSRGHLLRGFGTGLLLGAALLVWVLGVDQTDNIGEGAFIVSLTVVIVPFIARIFFGHKLSLNVFFALIPAVAGLAFLAFNASSNILGSFELKGTQGLFLLSTIGFAFHVILTGKFAQDIPYMALSCMQLAAIGFVATLAAGLTEEWPETLSSASWLWLLSSAFIATSLRFALQTKALSYLDPNNAAMVFVLEPVWTAILASLFLSQSMSGHQLFGCVLIFCALLIYRMPTMMNYLRLSLQSNKSE